MNTPSFGNFCTVLRNLRFCDTEKSISVIALGREKQNLQNGYENIEIIDSGRESDTKKIVCVKYSYMLNTNSRGRLWYFYQFHIEKREGIREITNRIPEKKFQDGYGEQYVEGSASETICHGKIMQ